MAKEDYIQKYNSRSKFSKWMVRHPIFAGILATLPVGLVPWVFVVAPLFWFVAKKEREAVGIF